MTTTAAIPPHNLVAEISVLGACLQDFEAARKASGILRAFDFFNDAHAELFSVVQSLVASGTPPDVVAVGHEVKNRNRLDALKVMGGIEYLARLVDLTPTAANVVYHARIVKGQANKRRASAAGARFLERLRGGAELGPLVTDLREHLDGLDTLNDGRPFLVRARDFKAEPVTFTVHNLIPAGMLALLSGRDKRGKTLLAQEIVRAVLQGALFLERFPTQAGPVVGAFLDDPPSLTRDRLEALGILNHPDLYLVDPLAFDGDAMRFLDRLEAEAAKVQPVLVVVDSFYQLVPPGRDAGNDQARMGPLMARLNQLAGRSAVLVVAHDNKSGADVAGSHVIRAAAKCIMRLTLPRGSESEDPDGAPATPRRILTVESKFGAATSWALEVRGVGAWLCFGSPQDLRAAHTLSAVRAFLANGGTGTAEEISEVVERRLDDVTKILKTLEEKGEAVTESRKRKKGRPATVYRDAAFPSGGALSFEAPEGNSDAQLFNFPKVTVTGDFPSRLPTPTDADTEEKPLETPAEVDL